MYEVTREFIGGILNGLTHTETVSYKPTLGFVCHKPIGGSPYRIISVVKVK